MRSLPVALLTCNAVSFLLGCQSGPDGTAEGAATVRALRYKRIGFESALEFGHGDGTWYEEMYFPDKGVVATMNSEQSWDESTQKAKYSPVLYVYPGEIGNKFAVSFTETIEQPTEEVRVEAELARKIFALGERQRELTEEQHGLGLMLLDSGLLRMNVGPPAEGQGER